MTAVVLRGDAAHLPLPDASVDLVVTSPPYFGQRDYRDGGESLEGQIGSEATPAEYVAALLECTREWMRILKPRGSIFVNLGDKYSGNETGGALTAPSPAMHSPMGMQHQRRRTPYRSDAPPKSLLGLPWRYALGCMDGLGLILRRDIIWHKLSAQPESVTDRCATRHEYLFHLVKQPRYFTAVDEIREPVQADHHTLSRRDRTDRRLAAANAGQTSAVNPLGKLPGSVWEMAATPLLVPPRIAHARCCQGFPRPGCEGLAHHAAFPFELPRRCILGWSPSGICVECKKGRANRAVKNTQRELPDSDQGDGGMHRLRDERGQAGLRPSRQGDEALQGLPAQGPADSCGDRRSDEVRRALREVPHAEALGGGDEGAAEWPEEAALLLRGTVDGAGDVPEALLPLEAARRSSRALRQGSGGLICTCPDSVPTRPALVVDPFAGTGTTMLTASVLGRIGVGIDRSADYCRLARWRTTDPGERARALGVPKPPPVPEGQASLFDLEAS